MSSVHARLTWSGEEWIFDDAGSRNGSLVNGRPTTRAVLSDRDVIQVGHTLLILRTALPTPAGSVDSADLAAARVGLRTLTPVFAKDLALLTKVAPSRVAILLRGETGTGKELVARNPCARAAE